jgi:hypothetical protein
LNKAIAGDDGGKGNMCLAASTASLSTPAKTVINDLVFLLLLNSF